MKLNVSSTSSKIKKIYNKKKKKKKYIYIYIYIYINFILYINKRNNTILYKLKIYNFFYQLILFFFFKR